MRSLLLLSFAALAAGCPGSHPASSTADTCANGVKDAGETDVDCGGPCPPCADGKACNGSTDCTSQVCSNAGTCAAPTCVDGVKNGGELGVDCGGAICPKCGRGVACTLDSACASGVCLNGACDCGDDTGVYVSSTSGLDSNPGTVPSPLKTIQAAVGCAYAPRDIKVEKGVYESTPVNPVALMEGRSLVGGYAAGFGTRDPIANVTEIRDTTDTGPLSGPNTTGLGVVVASTTTATRLEGFTIRATTTGEGIQASAISIMPWRGYVANGTILGNVLECGGSTGILLARCIDLGTSGGTIVVENNKVHLGTSQGTSWGIQGYGVASVVVSGNLFDGGTSGEIFPVDLWFAPSASPLIESNDVRLGTGGVAGMRLQLMTSAATVAVRNNVVVVAGPAAGIDDSTGAEISNNTVVADTGSGIRSRSSGARIQNDAIVTQAKGTCIEVTNAAAVPSRVWANDLSGCSSLFVNGTGTKALTLTDLNSRSFASTTYPNISADPLLDATSYRPSTGSPLFNAGVNLSNLFTTDKAGVARPTPTGAWTIGAYQNP